MIGFLLIQANSTRNSLVGSPKNGESSPVLAGIVENFMGGGKNFAPSCCQMLYFCYPSYISHLRILAAILTGNYSPVIRNFPKE